MNKAFLFDMDGVLVDSERISMNDDRDFLAGVFGKSIVDQLGEVMGTTLAEVYQKAVEAGTSVTEKELCQKADGRLASIYAQAEPIKAGELVAYLKVHGYRLGVVSATPKKWVDHVLSQLAYGGQFEVVISINDTGGLRSKPAPDGFLEALKQLDAEPSKSFVLEDSNKGIASGKAAGCYVIGYRGHLIEGYQQTGADAYVNTMQEVAEIVERTTQQ